jgi:hypothetical protein
MLSIAGWSSCEWQRRYSRWRPKSKRREAKARRAAPTQKACKRALANHDNGTSMIRQKSLVSVSVVAGRAGLHKHNVTQNKEKGDTVTEERGQGALAKSLATFLGEPRPLAGVGSQNLKGAGLTPRWGQSAWGSSPGGRDARGASRLEPGP